MGNAFLAAQLGYAVFAAKAARTILILSSEEDRLRVLRRMSFTV